MEELKLVEVKLATEMVEVVVEVMLAKKMAEVVVLMEMVGEVKDESGGKARNAGL